MSGKKCVVCKTKAVADVKNIFCSRECAGFLSEQMAKIFEVHRDVFERLAKK